MTIWLGVNVRYPLSKGDLAVGYLPTDTSNAFHLHQAICQDICKPANTDREEVEAT